jgi:phosphoglycolate phosphatase
MSPFSDANLVIFDIDGTLLATDEFWLDVGRRAVRTVYERRGIDGPLPRTDRFLGAIGLPMSAFWQYVLPEEHHGLVEEIEREAQEMEEVAFAQGLGAMYPGARALLEDLHEAGRAVALASNCGRRYLEGFIKAFDLGPLLAEARCVDSPGVRSKADMIADILSETGVGPAVMVGDRDNDRAAAHAHGVPFVLFRGGFGPAQAQPGDGVAATYEELRGLLLPESREEASR